MPLPTPVITIAGIACHDEGVTEHFSVRGDSQAQRKLLCAWTDRMALMTAILGGAIAPGIIATGLSYPDATWLGATDADVEHAYGPQGKILGPNGMIASDYARITVTYSPPTQATLGGGYDPDLIDLNFSTQALTLPRDRAAFKFDSGDSLPPEASPALLDPITNFSVPISGLTSLNSDLIDSLSGVVNSDGIFGATTETILFNGATSKQRFITTSSVVFDLILSFSRRRRGWNKFFNPKTQLFERVTGIDSGTPPYDVSPLSPLLSMT